jgi:hypothetical protein
MVITNAQREQNSKGAGVLRKARFCDDQHCGAETDVPIVTARKS